MRGTLRALATTGLLLVVGTAGLAGQTRVVLGLGGGAIVPTKGESSFGDDAKSVGYHFQVMAGVAPGGGKISVRFDGQYGSVNYEESTSGARPKDKILAVNADLVFHPSSGGSIRPYLLAGPTFAHLSHRSGVTGVGDVSDDKFGFNGGAGLNIGGTSKVWFFTEARYIYTKERKYIPITIGVRINTGQPYAAK
jgi:opacity protein-like surface antigen